MIGGDGVAEVQEAVRVLDVLDGLGDKLGALEEGRVVDVSRFRLPVVHLVVGGLEGVPSWGTLRDLVVDFGEHLRLEALGDSILGEGSRWPDVSEEDGLAGLVVAEGFLLEIDVHVADESVRDNQSR